MPTLYEEIYDSKNQFSFWKNWKRFLEKLDDQKIDQAKKYLSDFLGWPESIEWKTVVDFGCGSGLMSLCFVLLGAKKVTSVDIDKNSVECALYLRSKYKISPDAWEIVTGSVLDAGFVNSLEKFDIVYSWGVIHHTGSMWAGLGNVVSLTLPKGLLYVAIYNKFTGFPSSETWLSIKRFYSSAPLIIKRLLDAIFILEIVTMRILHGKNPIKYIREYYLNSNRGMDFFRDIEDWLGGYPYEYASVSEILDFYEAKGFESVKIFDSSAWTGCNEFLFRRTR